MPLNENLLTTNSSKMTKSKFSNPHSKSNSTLVPKRVQQQGI